MTLRGAALSALMVAGMGLGVGLAAAPRSDLDRPPEQASFACPVVRVHDGDTFTCASGERIRLRAIDAPEIGECRGHGGRCVSGDGYASRDALRRLALGRTAICRPSGRSYDRTVASCSVGKLDLSCAQVRAGQAVERYGRLTCP